MSVTETERVFLLPGEYHVTRVPCQMATLLGSCVSVCLTHETQPFAAMNHYLQKRLRRFRQGAIRRHGHRDHHLDHAEARRRS